MKDGEEKTIEFYTEEQSVSPPGFVKSIPSELFLECIEDTVVAIGTPEGEVEMFGKYPELESSARIMAERTFSNSISRRFYVSSVALRKRRIISLYSSGEVSSSISNKMCRVLVR